MVTFESVDACSITILVVEVDADIRSIAYSHF